MDFLQQELNWQPDGMKHGESIYTSFVQNYLFPRKFQFDKRRAHLSTLVCSKQLSRDEALREIEIPPIDKYEETNVIDYVTKKLSISQDDFKRIMQLPPKSFYDYTSYESNLLEWLILRLLTKPFPTFKIFKNYIKRKNIKIQKANEK
jgi:hypothetical protein